LPPADKTTVDSPTADTRVGIVIPVFNRRTVLLETLAHVVNQTHAPEKLIIVDDGSTDGTADAAEQWLSAARPRFAWNVIRCQHTTAATARCVGFEFVRELPWVAFLDSDDHWPVDFLARGVSALAKNPRAIAASSDRAFIRLKYGNHGTDDLRQFVANPIPWIFQNGAGIASCTVLSTPAVERAGGWKPELRVAEDSALFVDVARQGSWLHLPGEAVVFYVGSAALCGEENNLKSRFDDRHLRWARVYERIYERVCQGNPSLSRRPLQQALAHRWYAAARQLFRLGRIDEARLACTRSLRWSATDLRAWRLRLALTRTKQTILRAA
jgi:glycosyltransferase involved in cell wall biosynthesis